VMLDGAEAGRRHMLDEVFVGWRGRMFGEVVVEDAVEVGVRGGSIIV
jgi:hypothetical protein